MKVTKKHQAALAAAPDTSRTTEDADFPHAVAPPYGAGWEHALTEKYGRRGKKWTSTKSEPQWTVQFKEGDAAAWFKLAWTA